jgi:hypothetical protein
LPDQTKNQSGTLSKGNKTKDEDRDAVLKAWHRTQIIYGYSQQKAKPKQDMKKERKEYEKKYLARYKEPKAKPKKSSNLKHDDLGGINLRKHFAPKRREYLAKRKEYEKKYLARYKEPKVKPKKSSNLKYDTNLGKLNLRKHFAPKRREYLAKRKEYEEKYILQYMEKLEAKSKKPSSKQLDHDLISGRLNIREQIIKKQKELQAARKTYEKKYIARYKQPKAGIKKPKSGSEHDNDLGKLNFQKHFTSKRKGLQAERNEYEQKYLARYQKQQKTKQRKKKNN